MGKFTGFALVSDLDHTLINMQKQISKKNLEAIDYFKSQGGLFTVATGRTMRNVKPFFQPGIINAPVICYNGAVICDENTDEVIWSLPVGKECIEVIEFVEKNMPYAGCEIYSGETLYIHKSSPGIVEHIHYEDFLVQEAPLHAIPEPWYKVIFVQQPEETEIVRSSLAQSEFAEKYKFVHSWVKYYEILHKNTNKGRALAELCAITKLPISKMIAVGDNENDIEMVQMAGAGIAVANAVPELKAVADYCTCVPYDEDAIFEVVDKMDKGQIVL